MSPPPCNVDPTLSPAEMGNAFPKATDVTVLTTAMTTLMKSTVELIATPHAPRLHSPVQTSAVFPCHGAAMGTMTALITVMKVIAPQECLGPALPISLHVPTSAASHTPGAVTPIMIAETVQMKPTVISVELVIRASSSVLTIGALTQIMFVMVTGTVWMEQMNKDAFTTAQLMSSNVLMATSASTPTTDVTESLTVMIDQMSEAVLQGPQGCATMRVSFSASQMGAVYRRPGNVMVTRTARMAVTSITPAPLVPALPHCFAATTETVCSAAGSVMGTMTAET